MSQSVLRALTLKAPLHGQCALVLFCLLNQDRQLIPAPSMSAQEVMDRVEAFRVRQQEELGDGGAAAAEAQTVSQADAK